MFLIEDRTVGNNFESVPINDHSNIGSVVLFTSRFLCVLFFFIKISLHICNLHNWYKSAERKRKISQQIPEYMLNKNALSCSYYFKYITVLK